MVIHIFFVWNNVLLLLHCSYSRRQINLTPVLAWVNYVSLRITKLETAMVKLLCDGGNFVLYCLKS
jgi:hypothetical protein